MAMLILCKNLQYGYWNHKYFPKVFTKMKPIKLSPLKLFSQENGFRVVIHYCFLRSEPRFYTFNNTNAEYAYRIDIYLYNSFNDEKNMNKLPFYQE